MKTSFSISKTAKVIDVPAEAAPTESAPATSAPALREPDKSTSLAMPTENGFSGEVSQSDINVPSLQIVQAVGPLSVDYKPGNIVFAKELVLSQGDEPVTLTVMRVRKQFIENLDYNDQQASGQQARVFDRLEDVKAIGGSIEYGADGSKPSFVPIARCLVIVEAPKNLQEEQLFPFEFEGKRYAPGLWTLRNTSYTTAAKAIFTAGQFALKAGLHTGSWLLNSRREQRGKNMVHVPILRHNVKNSEAFQKFLLDVTSI